MTQISITLVPPFEQAVKLIESGFLGLGFSKKTATGEKTGSSDSDLASSSDLSINFNTVIVRLFYGGKKSKYFKGVLLAPEFDISPEGIVITLKSIGMLFQNTKISVKKSYENQTRLNILKQALGNNVTLVIPAGDAKCNEFMAKVEQLNANENQMSTIQKLLDKSNCVLLDRGASSPSGTPTYELMSKDFMRKRKSDVAAGFVLWGQIDPNNGVFPITNLSTTINNVLLGQTLGINTLSLDKATKDFTTSKTENSGKNTTNFSGKASSGDGTQAGGVPKELEKNVMNKIIPNFGGGHSLKDTLLGMVQAATDTTLQYKLETLGLVDLLPGHTVAVNVGNIKFLSGAYDLYEVRHEFGIDGVSTHLTLARTAGLATLISKAVENVEAKVNEVTNISSTSGSNSGNKKQSGVAGLIGAATGAVNGAISGAASNATGGLL